MLLQRDQELEAERHKAKLVAHEKREEKMALRDEIEWLEDVAYIFYE